MGKREEGTGSWWGRGRDGDGVRELGWTRKARDERRRKKLTIISTIRTRNQLLILPLERKPSFQIPLFGSCEV